MSIRLIVMLVAAVLAGVVVPWMAWIAIQSLVLESCAGHWGCAGGYGFALTYSSVAGAAAALAALIAAAVARRLRPDASVPSWRRALAAAVVLSVALSTVPRWPLSDYALVAAWFALCLLVFALAFSIRRRSGRSGQARG